MDIVNYVCKLVTDFGAVNPVDKVVSDVSGIFVKMREERIKKEEFRKNIHTVNPLITKVFSDMEKTYNSYSLKNPHPKRPSGHYIEVMRLKGWLDLDLDDPDLAPLFKK